MRRYSEDHQWVESTENGYIVGISAFAMSEIGEANFVELPAPGEQLIRGTSFCVVESMKAAAEIMAPVSGKVLAVNETLEKHPALLSEAPETEGWLCKMKLDDSAEWEALLTEEQYKAFLK